MSTSLVLVCSCSGVCVFTVEPGDTSPSLIVLILLGTVGQINFPVQECDMREYGAGDEVCVCVCVWTGGGCETGTMRMWFFRFAHG